MNALKNSKRITAKFDSTCTACQQICKAGQSVMWTPGTKGVKHVTCPVALDIKVEIKGNELRARRDALKAKRAEMEILRQDFFADYRVSDAEKVEICPECKGRGFKTIEWDSSETLDFRGTEHTNVRCGSKARILTTPSKGGWFSSLEGVEIDGVKAEYMQVKVGQYIYAVYGGINADCLSNAEKANTWARTREIAEIELMNQFPHFHEIENEINLCEKDLEIRRGDIATVINRGKPYTGVVTFVGAGTDFSRPYGTYRNHIPRNMPVRVTVRLADGTTKGGAIETAEFVSREETFSAA